jgi:tRNA-splicing ligase RtcB
MNVISDEKKPIKIWADVATVEPEAMAQLRNIARLPYVFHHVAVMPDVHLGKGATVGSVIASHGAISPAAVGVDIGCGMLAAPMGGRIDDLGSLADVRAKIENAVPVAHHGHQHAQSLGILRAPSQRVQSVASRAPIQLGTLGGGNHFIEICDAGNGEAWLMLHSGSRNVGKETAEIHIRKAKRLMEIWQIQLDDPDLAYLAQGVPEFDEYLEDLGWCQDYAMMNRSRMFSAVFRALELQEPTEGIVNCHHNYVATENHFGENVLVTRKGAVRARVGDMGIIPGSMGQRSYIVRGLGNPESFCSCSHGAGRRHSRTAAKKLFTVADLEAQTAGVECRKDAGVLDEIPSAYKSIDEVMANQADLVQIERELKAVLCVKG